MYSSVKALASRVLVGVPGDDGHRVGDDDAEAARVEVWRGPVASRDARRRAHHPIKRAPRSDAVALALPQAGADTHAHANLEVVLGVRGPHQIVEVVTHLRDQVLRVRDHAHVALATVAAHSPRDLLAVTSWILLGNVDQVAEDSHLKAIFLRLN